MHTVKIIRRGAFVALLALFALSACTKKKEGVNTAVYGSFGNGQNGSLGGANGVSGNGGSLGVSGHTPGSQADLDALVGKRIFFNYDSSTLTQEGRVTAQKMAIWMRMNPGKTVRVEGHADERGTRDYNLALGARRAEVVKREIAQAGTGSQRLSTISYGKERPLVGGSSGASYAQNRRVEFLVLN